MTVTLDTEQPWLAAGFLQSRQRFPERTALEIEDRTWSYEQLYQIAAAIADTLNRTADKQEPPLTAVLGTRSLTAYAGILGALFRGHGYVPLNPSFPVDRTRQMLQRAGCRALIVDDNGRKLLSELLTPDFPTMILLFPEHDSEQQLQEAFPGHIVITADDLSASGQFTPTPPQSESSIAYLLFTSGSTGQPKGVMVAHRNIHRFLEVMQKRYALNEHDRFSQMFDLVFDLSLFDLFMAWKVGGCLCCPTPQQALMPTQYIQDSAITVWFSVPSLAVLMMRLRQLQPDTFPTLRLSLFCGEALIVEAIDAWAKAAPNAIVENLYGPTEVTLACTLYRWKGEESQAECRNGFVPIGYPYEGMQVFIVDDQLNPVAAGEEGELLMSGPQVALGYWQDEEKTRQAFVQLDNSGPTCYRTGDLVRRNSPEAPIQYIGRVDNQVKIHGMRIELGEIEAAVKEASNLPQVVAIGWPVTDNGYGGIAVFVEGDLENKPAVIENLKKRLPGYMIPKIIRSVEQFPLNSNGKIDRKLLKSLLEN